MNLKEKEFIKAETLEDAAMSLENHINNLPKWKLFFNRREVESYTAIVNFLRSRAKNIRHDIELVKTLNDSVNNGGPIC